MLPIFLFCLNIVPFCIVPLLVVQWGFHFLRIIIIRIMVSRISSTTTTTFSSTSTSLGRYCIHFREWFKSSWMRLVIFHQKLFFFFFKPSWRWWRRKINGFMRSYRDAWFPSLIIAPRLLHQDVFQHQGSKIESSFLKFPVPQIWVLWDSTLSNNFKYMKNNIIIISYNKLIALV